MSVGLNVTSLQERNPRIRNFSKLIFRAITPSYLTLLPLSSPCHRLLLHRNRQPAEIDVDLQADLLAVEAEHRALLVLQHQHLPAGEDGGAAADRDIGAGDVVGAADVAHRAVEAGARGADEPAAFDDREADGALVGAHSLPFREDEGLTFIPS